MVTHVACTFYFSQSLLYGVNGVKLLRSGAAEKCK